MMRTIYRSPRGLTGISPTMTSRKRGSIPSAYHLESGGKGGDWAFSLSGSKGSGIAGSCVRSAKLVHVKSKSFNLQPPFVVHKTLLALVFGDLV